MEYRWGPPLKLNVYGKSTSELKLKQEWDKLDNKESEANTRTSFNIFNGVSSDKFHRISNYTRVKEV